MQVLLTFGLILILFILGGICVLIGVANLILRHLRKKRGQPVKKLHTVLASVFLTLGLVACCIPLLFFGMIRGGNLSMDAGYVDTGKYVAGGYQENSFAVDGVHYQALNLECGPLRGGRGTAVFSWDSTPDGVGGVWYRIFGYYNRGNYYEISNDAGVDLVTEGHKLFCPEGQMQTAMSWYSDPSNFDWYFSVGSDGADTKLPVLDDEKTKALFELSDQVIAAALPDVALQSGTRNDAQGELEAFSVTLPVDESTDFVWMSFISRDGVVRGDNIILDVYHNTLFLSGSMTVDDKVRTYTLYPLPAALNDYFSPLLLPQS